MNASVTVLADFKKGDLTSLVEWIFTETEIPESALAIKEGDCFVYLLFDSIKEETKARLESIPRIFPSFELKIYERTNIDDIRTAGFDTSGKKLGEIYASGRYYIAEYRVKES